MDEPLAVGQQVGAVVVVAGVALDGRHVAPAEDVADPDPQRHGADRQQGEHPATTAIPRGAPEDIRRRLVATATPGAGRLAGVRIDLVTIVVDDYDDAIAFFVGRLGFDLVEDVPARTNDGRPKRWVVVRPPGAATGLLLARADGEVQATAVGRQVAGRVGFFLRVDDVDASYRRLQADGVEFEAPPRSGALRARRRLRRRRRQPLGPHRPLRARSQRPVHIGVPVCLPSGDCVWRWRR